MRKLKKLARAYFTFSKKERNITIYIAFAIITITLLPTIQKQFLLKQYTYNYAALQLIFVSTPKTQNNSAKVFPKYGDSLYPFKKKSAKDYYTPDQFKKIDSKQDYLQPFVFDPNTITIEQMIQLGLSPVIAERINNYRSKGGRFKKKEDILKTYGFKLADFERLQAYIQIDSTQFIASKTTLGAKPEISGELHPTEINTAQKEILMALGFSADNAVRIINFRESSGGFYAVDQLYSIFGIDADVLERVTPFLQIDATQIRKMNINTIAFDGLAKHAYISDDLATAIIEYRNATGKFYALSELMKVKGMYPSLFEKLKPYLTL